MKLLTAARTILAVAGLTLCAPATLAQPAPEAPTIRADTRAFLELSKTRRRPPMSDEGVKMMRRIPPETMAKMFSEIEAPLGTIAVDRKLTMPRTGPGPGGTIDLRLFDPRTERPAGPVVVFYHGGGFVAGGIATHAPLAAEMARRLDLPVVSVEYRLAPENKWPAAPDDAEAAARWIAANGKALGREVDGLVLTGDSAGGTLTLVTALALRDKPAAAPLRLLIPLYPMADASRGYPSMEAFADGYGLNRADTDFFEKSYAADKHSPRHSALLGDLRGLPPTVLATASLDPLRDGGRAFAAKLIAAGVPVAFYEAAGTVHGFATYRKAIPSAQGDLDRILALARAMLRR